MGPCTTIAYPLREQDGVLSATEKIVVSKAAVASSRVTIVTETPTTSPAVREYVHDGNGNYDADDEDDYEDDDSKTVLSLLSEWDEKSENEKEEHDSNFDEYEKLRQQFAYRDALLQRISRGKSGAYLTSLRHHEELVRAEAFRMLKQQHVSGGCDAIPPENITGPTGNETSSEDEKPQVDPKTHVSPSGPSFLARTLLYETQITLPGLLGLVWYCSFHSAAYEAVQCLTTEAMRWTGTEAAMSYGCLVLALLITRLTGGVFEWVNNERHAQAKFDLHNRIRLRYWDAKLHLWFRNHPKLKFTLDYAAIYLCMVGVAYVHYAILLPLFEDRTWLIDNLPSRSYDFETPISRLLNEENIVIPSCDDDDQQQCSLWTELARQDEQYLSAATSVLSVQSIVGFGGSIMTSPLWYLGTHMLMACGSLWVLGKLGFRWN